MFPESLGGKKWSIVPDGVICAGCNQYFGSKVEPKALANFPFAPFRVFLGIPTKKNKPASMQTHVGRVHSGRCPGEFSLDKGSTWPFRDEKRGLIIIPTSPHDPLSVCRLLLKMALELQAVHDGALARSERFHAARTFSRAPKSNATWWFYLYIEHEPLMKKLQSGITYREWCDGVSLAVFFDQGVVFFKLRLPHIQFVTPLDDWVPVPVQDHDECPEPHHQVFVVRC